MSFGRFDAIFLFFLLPCFAALLFYARHRQRQAWRRLADPALQERLAPGRMPWRRGVKTALKFCGLIFLILALMEPQWGKRTEEVAQKGVNLMLLADVSNSMLAQDVSPSRLERLKRKSLDLMNQLSGDRVGLVAFAGRSFLFSPLTSDYGTLGSYIEDLNTDTIPVQGTDIAGALQLAIKSFPEEETASNAVLLMTDGEEHSEKMTKVLEELEKRGIKIFVLGIGTPEGAPVPDPQGGFKSDAQGKPVNSALQEGFLKDLAVKTGGVYARTVAQDGDLKALYQDGIRQISGLQNFKSTRKSILESRFYWPLGIALFFFFAERFFPELPRRRVSRRKQALAVLFLILGGSRTVAAAPWDFWQNYRAHQAYQGQEYKQAEKLFEKYSSKNQDLNNYFNLGASQFRQENYLSAKNNFLAATNSEDGELKANAYYNLGNTQYRLKQLPEALSSYEQVLKLRPNDEQAKLNYQFVKKQLESPPPESQPQKNQSGQQQGSQDGKGSDGQKQEQQSAEDSQQQQQQQQASKNSPTESKQDQKPSSGQDQKPSQSPESKQQEDKAQAKDSGKKEDKNSSPDKAQEAKNQEPSQQPQTPEQSPNSPPKPDSNSNSQASPSSPSAPEDPKDLKGKLESAGQQPESKSPQQEGKSQPKGQSPAQEQNDRWLEIVQDRSEEIRENQIKGALGRTPSPEKDW